MVSIFEDRPDHSGRDFPAGALSELLHTAAEIDLKRWRDASVADHPDDQESVRVLSRILMVDNGYVVPIVIMNRFIGTPPN